MFLAWFEVNKIYDEIRNLTCSNFSNKFLSMFQWRDWEIKEARLQRCDRLTLCFSWIYEAALYKDW